jgi:cytochrome c biogenesis protein CcmG/thiol:disulfide interchange protein DsbE
VAGVAMVLAVVLTIAVAELPKHEGGGPTQPARLTRAQAQARLAGSPEPLAALHAEGAVLLEGGKSAWRAQMQALKGWPIVVNKWASWCVPCKGERAVLAQAASNWGRRVAFLGVDSGDTSRADAETFLKATPAVSYPSYYDRSGEVGEAVSDSSFTPVTVFINAHGSRYIHQGPYESAQALERDIQRYAVEA